MTTASIAPAARPILGVDRRTGAFIALVPSSSEPGKFHVTTALACDCRGWKYRGTCKHLTAARAEAARVGAEQAPAPVAAVEPEPLPCAGCRLYHRTDAERIAAHPDRNPLRDGGPAWLAVKRAAGEWPR